MLLLLLRCGVFVRRNENIFLYLNYEFIHDLLHVHLHLLYLSTPCCYNAEYEARIAKFKNRTNHQHSLSPSVFTPTQRAANVFRSPLIGMNFQMTINCHTLHSVVKYRNRYATLKTDHVIHRRM